MNLSPHLTKSALEHLLPNATVAGGSFADLLPELNETPVKKQRSILDSFRDEGVSTTITELLTQSGNEDSSPIERGKGGNRKWPKGYTGSLTHKGTVVLGALNKKGRTRSIGIDLELDQGASCELSHLVHDGEIPPNAESHHSNLAVFSAKESIYKACYPIERHEVSFSEINITWDDSIWFGDRGVANCAGDLEVDVRCAYKGNWIITAAEVK